MKMTASTVAMKKSERKNDKYGNLYVDDEETQLSVFNHSFSYDFSIFVDSNGEDDLNLVNKESIHILTTDQPNQEMAGVFLQEKVIPLNPGIVLMNRSGLSDIGGIVDAVNEIEISKYREESSDTTRLKNIYERRTCRNAEANSTEAKNELIPDGDQRIAKTSPAQESAKGIDDIVKVFSGALILEPHPKSDNNCMHWVGHMASGQKMLLMLTAHIGKAERVIMKLSFDNIVSYLVACQSTLLAQKLVDKISDEYNSMLVSRAISSDASEGLYISVLLLDSASKKVGFASNCSGVKIFGQSGKDICYDKLSGSISLKEIKRVFLFSETLNGADLGDSICSQLIDESIEFGMDRQMEFLDQEINDNLEVAASNVTVVGFDIDNKL